MPHDSPRDGGCHKYHPRPTVSPQHYYTRAMLSRTRPLRENKEAYSGLEPVAAAGRDGSVGDVITALSERFCPNLARIPPPLAPLRNAHGQTAVERYEGLGRVDQNGDRKRVTDDANVGGSLENRLKKAITAKIKWQQKYENKNRANEELAKHAQSWKSAYRLEASKREALEEQLKNIRRASALKMESYHDNVRRLRDPTDPSNPGKEGSKPLLSPMRGFRTASGGRRSSDYLNKIAGRERAMASDSKLSRPGHLPPSSWVHPENPRLPRSKYSGNFNRFFHLCKEPRTGNADVVADITPSISSHKEVQSPPEDDGDDLTGIPWADSRRSTIKPNWASSGENYSDYYKEMPSRDPSTMVESDSLQSIFDGSYHGQCDNIFGGEDSIDSNAGVSRPRLVLEANSKSVSQPYTNTHIASNPPSSRTPGRKRAVTVAPEDAPMTSMTDGERNEVKWPIANARCSSANNTPAEKNEEGMRTRRSSLQRVDPCSLKTQDACFEEEERLKRSPVIIEGFEGFHSEDPADRIGDKGVYYNEGSGTSGSLSPGSSSCTSEADLENIGRYHHTRDFSPSYSPEHDSIASVENDDGGATMTSPSRGSTPPAIKALIPSLVTRKDPSGSPPLGGSSRARRHGAAETVNDSITEDSHARLGAAMKQSCRQLPCDRQNSGSVGSSATSLYQHRGALDLSDKGLERVNIASHGPCSKRKIGCGNTSELSIEARLTIGTVASAAGDDTANGTSSTATRCEPTNKTKPAVELPESIPRITELSRPSPPSKSAVKPSDGRATPWGCEELGNNDDGLLVPSSRSDNSSGMHPGMQTLVESTDHRNSGSPPAEHSSSTEDAVSVGPIKAGIFREEKKDARDSPRLFDSLLSIGVPDHWDLNSFTTNATSLKKSPQVIGDSTKNRVLTSRTRSAVDSASKWIRSVFSARTGSIKATARRSSEPDLSGSTTAHKLTATIKSTLSNSDANGAEKAIPVLRDCTVSGRLVPQVLAQYPPEAPLPCTNVADYCFPQGVRATAIDTRASQDSINKVSHRSLFKGETGSATRKAGEKPPDFCGTSPQETNASLPSGGSNRGGGGLDIEVWGCYCILTRLQFFDLHFQVLWDLLAAERIMRMQMVAQRSGRSITLTEEALLSSRTMELFEAVSQRYIRLAVPAPGETVRLTVHPDLPEICYRRSSTGAIGGTHIAEGGATIAFSYDIFAELRTSALPAYVANVADMIDTVVAWALPGALSRVPLDVLLTAVGALMCEYQVIVTSENLGLLSSAVLALAALARPLVWVHPVVPVMPMNMREVLSAPVPYLIGEAIDQNHGILGTPRLEGAEGDNAQAQLSAGQVLLDADEAKVTFAHPRDASDAKLPRCQALLARLEPLEKVLCESKGVVNEEIPLRIVSGTQAAVSEVVQATVAAHVARVCASALRHYDGIISSTPATVSIANKSAGSDSTDLSKPGVFTEEANGINKSGTTDASSVVSRAARATVDRQNIDISDEDEDNGSKALADGCDVAGASQGARWRGGRVRTSDLPFLRLLVRTQAFEIYRGAIEAGRDAEKVSVDSTSTR